jgi:hypothetical protein
VECSSSSSPLAVLDTIAKRSKLMYFMMMPSSI